jgi:signal peptidase
MDADIRDIAKYGIILLLLVGFFFGSTHILRTVLGSKYPIMVVVSQSMVPNLGVGDFIMVKQVTDFEEIIAGSPPEGDILVFMRNNYDEYIVHRAVEKYKENDIWRFITKGDNNAYPDGVPVPENRIVGKVIGRIPIIGYFSLFIKTLKGFGLVAILMLIAFFFDYILPPKTTTHENRGFSYISLIPFLIPPLLIALFWFLKDMFLTIELVAITSWYIGCLILPVTLEDDDTSLMLWLYHLVLVMIPISCDIVWWTMNITPSMWWYVQGSTVPITWLLVKETPIFQKAFTVTLELLLPGCLIFLGVMVGKRYRWSPIIQFSKILRNMKPD